MLAFIRESITLSFVTASHIPKWAGNKISRAHERTNIFIRFATAAFAAARQSLVQLKIALEMSQGRELAY